MKNPKFGFLGISMLMHAWGMCAPCACIRMLRVCARIYTQRHKPKNNKETTIEIRFLATYHAYYMNAKQT